MSLPANTPATRPRAVRVGGARSEGAFSEAPTHSGGCHMGLRGTAQASGTTQSQMRSRTRLPTSNVAPAPEITSMQRSPSCTQ